ncbi:MAG: hypothetical protein O3A95_03915 [Planctomycetota bacterium]|nr:hypothetical protein [Planctomycetota bacterium]MDA1113429.1 hypothetical protein [Planctomycetota bacterium]
MNRGLRLFGISGAALTLLWVAVDLQRHVEESASLGAGDEKPPPGFRQRMRGLGWTEISFKGHVEMEAEKRFPQEDGSVLVMPSYKVTGSDPIPLGEGMRLGESIIRSPDDDLADGKDTSFVVTSPKAWIPLVQGQERFAFDMDRLWQLEDPVFEKADFHKGSPLRIETAHADLDPETDQIFGRGPFLLVSGDLRLEGSDIFFDPETSRVEFQPLDGELRWNIRDQHGAVFQGFSDGPGSFSENSAEGFSLEFHAIEQARTVFPAESVMPGILLTRDMTLHLVPSAEGGWLPAGANALGPTNWQGDTLKMVGADSEVVWKDNGDLDFLTVLGPVTVTPLDDSFDWASANNFARFRPKSEVVRLEGQVKAKHGRGLLTGDWAELGPDQWEVGGSVVADGDEGIAQGDLLHTDRKGNWTLSGGAEIQPQEGQVDWLRSPEIHFNEKGRVYTDAGFTLQATVDEKPLFASGDQLDSKLERGRSANDEPVRRTSADGNLYVRHQGRELRGAKLEQTDEKAFRILGDPVSKTRVTGNAVINETPIALDCGRLSWNGTEVTIEDAPLIEVDAATLGLQGDVIQIRARKIMQHEAEGVWELRDDVILSGALVGSGDRVFWEPGNALKFFSERRDSNGQDKLAFMQGTLEDGREIQARGEHIEYDDQGRLSVHHQAYLAMRRPSDTAPNELWGDEVELGETSGWAIGNARFQTAESRGSAHRIDWTRDPNLGDLVVLEKDAVITRGNILASGPHLEVDTRVGTITAIGAENLPAKLRAEDGRTAVGDWLRYHLDSGRFESRGARFESP